MNYVPFVIRKFALPTVSLFLNNPTNNPVQTYIGGLDVHQQSISTFGNIISNSHFEQGAVGWAFGGSWVLAVGSATWATLAPPDISGGLGQIIAGLTVGSTYLLRVQGAFSAPFTGSVLLQITGSPAVVIPVTGAVGAFSYQANVTVTLAGVNFLGVQVNSIAPTLAGTQVILSSIEAIAQNDEQVQFYKFFNSSVASNPVRMRNTRLIFSDVADIPNKILYERKEVTGAERREPILLTKYRNPMYVAQNIVDIQGNVTYLLDGTHFISILLAPNSWLAYSADIDGQVVPAIMV